MFVLTTSKEYAGNYFFSGKIYRVQGETFANCVNEIRHAKRYTTRRGAEKAAEALNNKVANYSFNVLDIGTTESA